MVSVGRRLQSAVGRNVGQEALLAAAVGGWEESDRTALLSSVGGGLPWRSR